MLLMLKCVIGIKSARQTCVRLLLSESVFLPDLLLHQFLLFGNKIRYVLRQPRDLGIHLIPGSRWSSPKRSSHFNSRLLVLAK